MEEYIVANYMVYAFLLVLMWRQQLVASYVASFEKDMGRGLQEEENPWNLLHLHKQKVDVNGWELAGAAIL